ncbi:aspartate/ornithine carbamoyltransferase carbamoyl-P binding domain [Rhizobium leguminosarum bv. trifolii WSM2304]|uniref:Aspartate/ornithine carbamoyltransferase carbamoyl-P binding domain n=1 Tax=Rhizobium leguminosarum bv. trifolii (strain WSM2304) TaxID=395492 RepID=A0ABF7QRJ1_RHILW|nr:ornithine carbamoyltransferase [Rhizobium leguminosarum]ACI56606.1 aspartate/ornithine carbamoyltransferase carbamoyl-P binding domain [Rhizobium leguminosarum bv. trifolii WSM2304]
MTASARNFLEFHDIPEAGLRSIIARAGALARAWNERTMPQSLAGRRVALIADDSGWRNTTAFDLGVQAMGGICVHVPIGFNGREEPGDLAGYLGNWFDMMVIRTRELAVLKAVAAAAPVPVINARTRSNHPCETLGDLAYINSRRGSIDGLKVVGVAADANILRSWVEASIALPIEVVQVYPERWHISDTALLNERFRVSTDMGELSDANIIITDSWPGDAVGDALAGYRIGADILDRLPEDAIFLPCPPVTRGQEVTAEAMEHSLCQSRAAKAFLLHAQNALMEWVVG